MKTHRTIRGITLFATVAALFFAGSLAGAADFYAGKTITIVCPYSTGGTYDRMSRLAAKFLPRHIPGNPAAIVHNRPGAGGVIGNVPGQELRRQPRHAVVGAARGVGTNDGDGLAGVIVRRSREGAGKDQCGDGNET